MHLIHSLLADFLKGSFKDDRVDRSLKARKRQSVLKTFHSTLKVSKHCQDPLEPLIKLILIYLQRKRQISSRKTLITLFAHNNILIDRLYSISNIVGGLGLGDGEGGAGLGVPRVRDRVKTPSTVLLIGLICGDSVLAYLEILHVEGGNPVKLQLVDLGRGRTGGLRNREARLLDHNR